jgi:hypothetical protein
MDNRNARIAELTARIETNEQMASSAEGQGALLMAESYRNSVERDSKELAKLNTEERVQRLTREAAAWTQGYKPNGLQRTY